MITNFEDITTKLSQDEYRLVTPIIKAFKRITKDNPIFAGQIVLAIKSTRPDIKFDQVKLRKLVSFIRQKGMIPLIATSKGYYCSYDIAEIDKQIKSLRERAMAIESAAEGLEIVKRRILENPEAYKR